MSSFNSVLIANRGEIACRIIRTAKALGYRTIAVYSDADANAPHTKMADDAVHIGASPVNQSYLAADKIFEAAKRSGAQAIHPGYGFFSENAEFSQACEKAGLVFIGPSAHAIEVMGNKAESKRHMLKAGVPCVPGYEGENQQDEILLIEAEKIGVPIMVKAAAGGGGRGMRLVEDLGGLANAIKLARSEAENAFGCGELILEKAIIEPRHVEIQIFADQMGNTVYLGERDCSVQRRHQKVIEEAPCPVMTEDLRVRMGESAVAAAKSISYVGAGTVEFLLDAQGQFYFLEMNTRLQVEHPVTELITGLDLVALQLQVAQGEALGFSQEDVSLIGHAIEVRLYTEDPAQDFLPTAGTITRWQAAQGEGVRIDSGIESGQAISPFYDPMVAKIIAFGANREVARRRLIKALKNTVLFGVENNKGFLINCLEKQKFIDGQATTAFIQQEFKASELAEVTADFEQAAMAAVIQHENRFQQSMRKAHDVSPRLKNWSSAGGMVSNITYALGDTKYSLSICPDASKENSYCVSDVDNNSVLIEIVCLGSDRGVLRAGGLKQEVHFIHDATNSVTISFGKENYEFIDQIKLAGGSDEAAGGGQVIAPMHGLVLDVKVEAGQAVNKGQALLVIEAMKMQHQILAAADGRVNQVFIKSGEQVSADDVLIEIAIEQA